jgi:hypothetical protein
MQILRATVFLIRKKAYIGIAYSKHDHKTYECYANAKISEEIKRKSLTMEGEEEERASQIHHSFEFQIDSGTTSCM